MRSRAHFKGHPIHPALIPYPFAFLTGALLFDALGILVGRPGLWITGAYLTIAGLAAGVAAAIPGALDYLYTVPPDSSGRQRATRHAVGNVLALAAFGAAFLLRTNDWEPTTSSMVTEVIGTGVLLYSASLGGTLVTRNLISVDHRYAQAGKWQEAWLTPRGRDPLVVGHVDDLKENQMKLLHVNGRRIVLARTSEGYRAFEDRCTHRGGSLAGGVLICDTVQCLWHGSQFNLSTGSVACGPAKQPIRTFDVVRKGDQLVLAGQSSFGDA